MVLQIMHRLVILRVITLLFVGFFSGSSHAQNQYEVKFFLLEDCKISQAYTPEIRQLVKSYASDSIHFEAFFPHPSSTQASVDEFMHDYALPITYQLDKKQSEAKKYGIRIMPEVVVYEQLTKRLLYRGRIDNLFAGLGKRRSVATERELHDCLLAIRSGKNPFIPFTDAIGCFLENPNE